jgi:hypothetical protein
MTQDLALQPDSPQSLRILYVTSRFPWPLTTGFLRHFHLVRELSARHSIHLLSLAGSDLRYRAAVPRRATHRSRPRYKSVPPARRGAAGCVGAAPIRVRILGDPTVT